MKEFTSHKCDYNASAIFFIEPVSLEQIGTTMNKKKCLVCSTDRPLLYILFQLCFVPCNVSNIICEHTLSFILNLNFYQYLCANYKTTC